MIVDLYEKKFHGAILGVALFRPAANAVALDNFAFAVRLWSGRKFNLPVTGNTGVPDKDFYVAVDILRRGMGILADPTAEQLPGAVMGA